MSCRVFHLRCVCVPGKQKHIRLTPVAALNGDNVDSVKIVETKGCSVFCTGLVRQGTSHVLCVAIKRNIMLYELNRTKIRHRRIKDITCPGNVQFIEMMNERLCVGYPSSFAIYSVQGDSAPQGEAGYNFFFISSFSYHFPPLFSFKLQLDFNKYSLRCTSTTGYLIFTIALMNLCMSNLLAKLLMKKTKYLANRNFEISPPFIDCLIFGLVKFGSILQWYEIKLINIPPASTKLIGGYTGITLSVCPSVDRIVSALYLQQYSSDPFHICTSYQATSEGVSRVMPVSKFKNSKFWRIFLKICNFDFVIFWLGIQYDSMVWVIMRRRGVSSERRRSSCSSLISFCFWWIKMS